MLKLLTVSLLLLTLSCNTRQATNEAPSDSTCKTKATVVDLTGLDGCRFLLEVENEGRWLPLKMSDPNFKFHKGQQIAFDYEEVEDYISICMAEQKGVNITCIKEIKSAQQLPPACTEVPNMHQTEWIKKLIDGSRITHITQYPNDSGYLYYFINKSNGYLYDCKGTLLCDHQLNTQSDCSKKVATLNNGTIIMVTNN